MSEIWRDFDPALEIPQGLKNVNVVSTNTTGSSIDTPDTDFIESGLDTIEDEDQQDFTEISDDTLDPPSAYTIVSQTVRTAPDGRQVVDIVLDVEEVRGARDYQVRVTV